MPEDCRVMVLLLMLLLILLLLVLLHVMLLLHIKGGGSKVATTSLRTSLVAYGQLGMGVVWGEVVVVVLVVVVVDTAIVTHCLFLGALFGSASWAT